MGNAIKLKLNYYFDKSQRAISSKYFLYFILGLVIVQGLWFITSIQPTYYDETRHIAISRIYSEQPGLFISHQPEAWDESGDVTRDSSYFYYFLMGNVLRVTNILTDNATTQVIILRLVNLTFFTAGVYLFWKLLKKVGNSVFVANMSLLFFVLIPIVAPLAGVVSYDNLIFLFTALLFLCAVQIIETKKPKVSDIARFLIIALFGVVIKYTSIALVAPVAGYIIYELFVGRKRTLKVLVKDFNGLSQARMLILVALLLFSLGLFIERPVKNMLAYGRIQPDCEQIMAKARCNNNYTAKRNLDALRDRPADFQPLSPFNFALAVWVPEMIRGQAVIVPSKQPFPIIVLLFYTSALSGVALVLIQFKDLMKSKSHKLLFVGMVTYSLILMAYTYVEYTKYGMFVAISGRYLIPIIPIFLYFVTQSVRLSFGAYRKSLLITGVAIFALVVTQGGGIATANLTIDKTMFWQTGWVLESNERLSNLFTSLIKENIR